MEWINYHHLLYFWLVAREGSLARASAGLRLAPSTVSGQIKTLEDSLGASLFVKSGRRLVLSETGQTVYRYAEEIFTLGRELQDTLKDRPVGKPLRLTVGVAKIIPKPVVRELMDPALRLTTPVLLVCREARPEQLLEALSLHELDVVLSDAPASSHIKAKAFNHLLVDTNIIMLAYPDMAARLRPEFPASLDGAPLLMPAENTALRRSLDHWLEENAIHPVIVGEFDDMALLNEFGKQGLGLFPVPSLVAAETVRQTQTEVVGALPQVRQRFYAVTVERRLMHPAAAAICHGARRILTEGAEG